MFESRVKVNKVREVKERIQRERKRESETTYIAHDLPIIKHQQRIRIKCALRGAVHLLRRQPAHNSDPLERVHDLADLLQHLVRADLVHVRDGDICLGDFVFGLEVRSGGGAWCDTPFLVVVEQVKVGGGVFCSCRFSIVANIFVGI